jgi:hypothetical protein
VHVTRWARLNLLHRFTEWEHGGGDYRVVDTQGMDGSLAEAALTPTAIDGDHRGVGRTKDC